MNGLQQPIDFCITLDNSGSMGYGFDSRLQQVKNAAKDFVERRDLSADKFGVVRFDDTVSTMLHLSDRRNQIIWAIDSIGAGGGTSFAGALFESAKVLYNTDLNSSKLDTIYLRKKAVLFFTDGQNADRYEALEQAQQLRDSGIIICAVATEDADRSYLEKITGDRDLVIIARSGDIAEAFRYAETAIEAGLRRS